MEDVHIGATTICKDIASYYIVYDMIFFQKKNEKESKKKNYYLLLCKDITFYCIIYDMKFVTNTKNFYLIFLRNFRAYKD